MDSGNRGSKRASSIVGGLGTFALWLAPSKASMPHYIALDVSQKTTAICVVDDQGRRLGPASATLILE